MYISNLKANKLFHKLDDKTLVDVRNRSHMSRYAKGEIIHWQGETCHTLGVILRGDVLVQSLDSSGRVLTIVNLGIGETFGGNIIFADETSLPMTVSANSHAVILHIDREVVIDLCQKDKNFLIEFMKSLSNKTLIVSNKLNAVTMKSVREKIIDFLVQEHTIQKSCRIILPFSRKEWAEYLGVARPSLSRELSKMKADELIDYAKDWVQIIDSQIFKK